MKKTVFLVLVISAATLFSCNQKKGKQQTDQVKIEESKNQVESATQHLKKNENEMRIITENSFLGFKVGDSILVNSKNLKKELQQSGEGSFSRYAVLDDNGEKVGTIFPKYNNRHIIGRIEISSAKYKTKEGIGIGSTYKDLKDQYPNLETHGSEIESSTTSYVGSLSFLLDAHFNTYKIDETKIKPTTEVIKVSIQDVKE